MNVAQLIAKLEEFPAKTPVIITRTRLGNSSRPVFAITTEQVTNDGEVIHKDDVNEWCGDELKTKVVLWP